MQFIHNHSVEPDPCLWDGNLFIYLCQWETERRKRITRRVTQMPRSAGIIQLQMEYRVSLGELLSPSLYLRIICLDWKHFRASRSYVMEREWRVDNRPHGAPSSGPDSRGRPGGREHARAHTHSSCVHSRPPRMKKSLSAVVSKWSICKSFSQEGDIWP